MRTQPLIGFGFEACSLEAGNGTIANSSASSKFQIWPDLPTRPLLKKFKSRRECKSSRANIEPINSSFRAGNQSLSFCKFVLNLTTGREKAELKDWDSGISSIHSSFYEPQSCNPILSSTLFYFPLTVFNLYWKLKGRGRGGGGQNEWEGEREQFFHKMGNIKGREMRGSMVKQILILLSMLKEDKTGAFRRGQLNKCSFPTIPTTPSNPTRYSLH